MPLFNIPPSLPQDKEPRPSGSGKPEWQPGFGANRGRDFMRRFQWAALLLVVVTLFFWKILFTRQFSVFVDYDNANQAYAWDQFSAKEIQSGRLPLWDPYIQAGRTFVGEMQTALFYPPKLALYLWP